MATYIEQVDYAKSHRLKEGGSYRGDCPFCSGRNTYGVTVRSGVLTWGCFKASCDVKGRWGEGLSIEGINTRLRPPEAILEGVRITPIPVLTSIETHPSILQFLRQYNSLTAYEKGYIDIRYSPTEDRIMFPTKTKEGYTGRGRKGVFPKWKKFGNCGELLTCGNGKIGVVVEDALSACAVGAVEGHVGCALLGTILTPNHIIALREYDRLLVCLDPDARSKGLAMASRLGSRASIRNIPNDLKNYDPEEIRKILNDGTEYYDNWTP